MMIIVDTNSLHGIARFICSGQTSISRIRQRKRTHAACMLIILVLHHRLQNLDTFPSEASYESRDVAW